MSNVIKDGDSVAIEWLDEHSKSNSSLASAWLILKKYYDVGWKYIYWSRSSEDDERAGLTCIMFSTTPIENEIYIQNKHIFKL